MEDKLDEFINYDTVFIDKPRFYTELTILSRTTGEALDEALSMSTEYLSNVGNVDNIYQESMMSCIDWSSRIATLTAPGISISRCATSDLLTARIHLKRTLTRMEAHWKNLQEKTQSRGDKVVFLELQNLVETARHTADNLPPYWDRGLTIPDPSDNQIIFESESASDNPLTAEEWEHTISEDHEAIATMESGEHGNAIPKGPPQINQTFNLPNTKLDKNERENLRRIAETVTK